MRCPKCSCQDDKVIDSRASREGAAIRRRRECISCGHRYTTYEQIERTRIMVKKRDGRCEEFSREKLLSGIEKACQKRPVSQKTIEDLLKQHEKQTEAQYNSLVKIYESMKPKDAARIVAQLASALDMATDLSKV